jgi:hypothetical protein
MQMGMAETPGNISANTPGGSAAAYAPAQAGTPGAFTPNDGYNGHPSTPGGDNTPITPGYALSSASPPRIRPPCAAHRALGATQRGAILSAGSSLSPGKRLHHQRSSSSHDASPHPQGERLAAVAGKFSDIGYGIVGQRRCRTRKATPETNSPVGLPGASSMRARAAGSCAVGSLFRSSDGQQMYGIL